MARVKMLQVFFAVAVTLFLCSCMARGKMEEDGKEGEGSQVMGEVATYSRETVRVQLEEGAIVGSGMDYSAEGIFYYVRKGDSYQDFSFYFQPYASEKNGSCLFEKEGGGLRDLSAVKREDGMHYCLLWADEEAAYISDYDAQGKLCAEHALKGQGFETPGKWPVLQALTEGGYLLGMDDKAYHVQADGSLVQSITVQDGHMESFVQLENGRKFAVYQDLSKKSPGRNALIAVAELDLEKNAVSAARTLSVAESKISAFEGTRMVYCDGDFAYLIDMDEAKDEQLIDLKRQSILASQIEGIYGTREEILVVSRDPSEGENGIRAFRLMPKAGQGTDGQQGGSALEEKGGNGEKPKYSEDGRRIVRVAISNDEDWPWEIVYRAQKYSQDSDAAFVEVEMFDGPVENYLGRGEKPDIIMLHDQADIAPLVEINALADINPLYEKQNAYSIDDILPSVREALSVGDGLYAMANTFQLLLCTSDGTDEGARMSTADYLKWYDAYLDEKGAVGMPDLDELFFAILPGFYDEGERKAYFDSEDFKELMALYKDLKKKHAGEWTAFDGKFDVDARVVNRIAEGPKWIGMLLTETQLTKPEVRLTGVPTRGGEQVVCVKLPQPLAILNASDCKEEALDFILYAKRTKTSVGRSAEGEFHENGDKQQANTNARFWVFDEYLKEDIWETEKYCWVIQYEQPIDGWKAGIFDITEEHKEMLRGLMDSAVGVTKTQNDVFGMFLEEMDGYLHGNKDLDGCCEILQNRVSLYLAE